MFVNSDLKHGVYYDIDYIVKQRGKPEMIESLRLIVEDIIVYLIVYLRTRSSEPLGDVTSTDVLLALASQGFVEFEGVELGKYVWVATPELIDCLETGGYGIDQRTNRRRPKIRMDTLVTKQVNQRLQMSKLPGSRFTKPQKRRFRVHSLFDLEKDGDAIPYKDDDGRLAWKASEYLRGGQ